MKTTTHHQAVTSGRSRRTKTGGPASASNGWRCVACGKLLGVYRGEHMHVRIARNHEYLVSLPVTATCHGCGTLNEALGPARFKRNDDIPF